MQKIEKIKFLNIQSVLYLYLFLNLLVFPKAQEWPLVSYSGSVSGFSTWWHSMTLVLSRDQAVVCRQSKAYITM